MTSYSFIIHHMVGLRIFNRLFFSLTKVLNINIHIYFVTEMVGLRFYSSTMVEIEKNTSLYWWQIHN